MCRYIVYVDVVSASKAMNDVVLATTACYLWTINFIQFAFKIERHK